jgi:hypothetical protein
MTLSASFFPFRHTNIGYENLPIMGKCQNQSTTIRAMCPSSINSRPLLSTGIEPSSQHSMLTGGLRNSLFLFSQERAQSFQGGWEGGGREIDFSVNCDFLATPLFFSLIQLLFRYIAKSGIPPATWTRVNCKPVGN